jgi:hypothetical protein
MTKPVGPNFIQRRLDPATPLGEIVFGFMMVLKRAPDESAPLGMNRQMMGPLATPARDDFYPGMNIQLRDVQPLETRITGMTSLGHSRVLSWWCCRAFPQWCRFWLCSVRRTRGECREECCPPRSSASAATGGLTHASGSIVGLALLLVGVSILLRG